MDRQEWDRPWAVAVLGVSDSVSGAESIVERALKYVEGDFYVRHDVGRLMLNLTPSN